MLLGSLENEVDELDLFDDRGGWVFSVDNLTDEDRVEAAACRAVANHRTVPGSHSRRTRPYSRRRGMIRFETPSPWCPAAAEPGVRLAGGVRVEAFGADTEWFLIQPPRLWVSRFPADRAAAVRIAAGVAELVLPEWRAAARRHRPRSGGRGRAGGPGRPRRWDAATRKGPCQSVQRIPAAFARVRHPDRRGEPVPRSPTPPQRGRMLPRWMQSGRPGKGGGAPPLSPRSRWRLRQRGRGPRQDVASGLGGVRQKAEPRTVPDPAAT